MYARNARHVPLQWRVDNKQGVITGSADYNLQPYTFAIALHPCDFPAPSPTRSGARQTQRLAATFADQVFECQICQHAAYGGRAITEVGAGSVRVHRAEEGWSGTSLRGLSLLPPNPDPPYAHAFSAERRRRLLPSGRWATLRHLRPRYPPALLPAIGSSAGHRVSPSSGAKRGSVLETRSSNEMLPIQCILARPGPP